MGLEVRWKARLTEPTLPQQSFPHLLWKILTGRGLNEAEQIQSFLFPSLKDLSRPENLKGISEAVQLLWQSYLNEEKVCIYADFDMDGTSGLALLYEGLKRLGFQGLEYYQPLRLSEGYGIHKSALDEIHVRGVQTLVTVDVGIDRKSVV